MLRSSFAVMLLTVAACAPGRSMVRHHLEDGVHLYQRGDYADARDCFQTALTLKPGDADILYNLAQCHEHLGQAKKAQALYEDCIRLDADHPEARHAWLEMMLQSDREKEGRRMVEEWMQARPNSAGPHVEQAWLHIRDRNPDRARVSYQKALNLDPNNNRALVGLAELYVTLDHNERALVLYERSLDANPNQPSIARLVRRMREKGVRNPQPD